MASFVSRAGHFLSHPFSLTALGFVDPSPAVRGRSGGPSPVRGPDEGLSFFCLEQVEGEASVHADSLDFFCLERPNPRVRS